MALLVKRALDLYKYTFFELSDGRVDSLPLMSSPIPLFFILILYQLFVQKIGPAYMANRKPFNLDKLIQVYNVIQVVLCLYIVVAGFKDTLALNWRCSPVVYDPDDYLMIRLGYLYFVLKVTDLMDTVFFVLRKKMNQVTFLHVYHHTGMALVAWTVFKYHAGGHSIYMGYINSFVHVVMYSYYFVSNYNQKYKKSLWWKKYITQIQLVQFVLCAFLYAQPLVRRECQYSNFVSIMGFTQNLYMFVLFSKFYFYTYVKKTK